ncbi:MAG: glutaminyl-tRNA synthase (glutamine-hydrolyzing) subunit B [Chloroflexi bacterium RBG_16_57_11]|nr:MAG: glutaminyl-tRNA synthase (glutamine-hydrolyzing) subunit B [Chloroflexi bacterium RBG_16_57_11]
MEYEAVIGLEVHAELATRSKMFCACAVVDSSRAEPNVAVCPVCAGMPGALPVLNRRAVEYGLRVALALGCEIIPLSIFARKNYFYPDLPKGYQISQYEQPLAVNGCLKIQTSQGERLIRVRRVHLEEDAGKLTHVERNGEAYSLVDLNRAGVPLLEIVSEPDMRSAEEARLYAMALRSILRYLGVNSGDMQKGVMRVEPNISVRPVGSQRLGTRTEIKNLNSFRALERSTAFEIQRQSELLRQGRAVIQETRGWDEAHGVTLPQRSKEEADDYRYFPEPDLPPLAIDPAWLEAIRASLPELPEARLNRFQAQYGLSAYDAGVLADEPAVAAFYEQTVKAASEVTPKVVANWISGDLFGLLNQAGVGIEEARVTPGELAGLLRMLASGELNQTTARGVLREMFESGESAEAIVAKGGLRQISDQAAIAGLVRGVLEGYPKEVQAYLGGKETLAKWLFGQVMRAARGQANPQVLQGELERQLGELRKG